MEMSNQELLLAWINALESNVENQTYGFLRTSEIHDTGYEKICYCAMGLLLNIAYPDGWLKGDRPNDYVKGSDRSYQVYYHRRSDGENGIETPTLVDMGVSPELQYQVLDWNDSCLSFNKIANKLKTLVAR